KVRASADQMAGTINRLVEQRQDSARGFLNSAASLCGEKTPTGRIAWELGCAGQALAEFRATEHARGALLEYRRRRIALSGEPPPKGQPIAPGFARIVSRLKGFDYVVAATVGDSTLTEHFAVDDLDILFRNHSVM